MGGTGFVGGHVVEYLFRQGEISKGIFRLGSHLKILDTNGVQVMEADLADHHSLHEAMEGVDVVYSMASPMPGSDSDFMKVNTEGLLNLTEAASEAKVKAFVHLSTVGVYGFGAKKVDGSTPFRPGTEYQSAKAEAERLLMEFSKGNPTPRVAIIRAAKAVGSRDTSLVTPLLRMIGGGRVVLPASGTMSFSHPGDIAQAMFRAATADIPTGAAYLVKSFDASPQELAQGIMKAVGTSAMLKKQGVLSGSQLPRHASEELKAATIVSGEAGWAELGYSPQYDLEKAAEEIATWYRKEPWVAESA